MIKIVLFINVPTMDLCVVFTYPIFVPLSMHNAVLDLMDIFNGSFITNSCIKMQ